VRGRGVPERRMHRASVLIFLLAGITGVTAACRGSGTERVELIMGGEKFSVEVARSREEQQQGLMFRKRLGSRDGMLFVYDRDRQLTFWMKNTEIPLSIAFLTAGGEILEIHDMEPLSLKSVSSRRAARYALEVPRGTFAALHLKEGDRVLFPPDFR
jgi:uncharacterized membrane protein (UPF0127 family)